LQEDAVASQEEEKVHDVTSFLLLSGRCRGLPENTEGLRYHILSFAYRKMPLPPRKYGMFMISHPFFCVREDDVASQEVRKVQDITSFLLLARRCRGLPVSRAGARYHILSFACKKMPWRTRKYGRCKISQPFFRVQ
jgi:hypothetical protein